jgi:predicted RNA methylase
MATLPRSADPAPYPHIAVARSILACFRAGERVDRALLRHLFETATGASDASGAWSMRQAFDAMELAQALFAAEPSCPLLRGPPQEALASLEAFVRALPVQSARSEAQVALQQFSTPLGLAYLAGLAAQPRPEDLVLEPSAGNGLLAWPAARAGSRLLLNELDPTRRASLRETFPEASITMHDAELIDDLLDPVSRPSLVLMNPPFARSTGRGNDRYAAARHLAAALARLAREGRLVAIMPESFSTAGTGRSMRASSDRAASLRLDVLISQGAFDRHGTSVGVRLIVYDGSQRAG